MAIRRNLLHTMSIMLISCSYSLCHMAAWTLWTLLQTFWPSVKTIVCYPFRFWRKGFRLCPCVCVRTRRGTACGTWPGTRRTPSLPTSRPISLPTPALLSRCRNWCRSRWCLIRHRCRHLTRHSRKRLIRPSPSPCHRNKYQRRPLPRQSPLLPCLHPQKVICFSFAGHLFVLWPALPKSTFLKFTPQGLLNLLWPRRCTRAKRRCWSGSASWCQLISISRGGIISSNSGVSQCASARRNRSRWRGPLLWSSRLIVRSQDRAVFGWAPGGCIWQPATGSRQHLRAGRRSVWARHGGHGRFITPGRRSCRERLEEYLRGSGGSSRGREAGHWAWSSSCTCCGSTSICLCACWVRLFHGSAADCWHSDSCHGRAGLWGAISPWQWGVCGCFNLSPASVTKQQRCNSGRWCHRASSPPKRCPASSACGAACTYGWWAGCKQRRSSRRSCSRECGGVNLRLQAELDCFQPELWSAVDKACAHVEV